MIKLFKNVVLMPNGFFFRDQTEDVILIENPDETFLMVDTDKDDFNFIGYSSTYEHLLRNKFNNSETEFFSFLLNYPADRLLTVYASKTEFAKIYLRFLVDLYPRTTNEDLVQMYDATLDKMRLLLDGKLFDFQPHARRTLIVECTITDAQVTVLLNSYRSNPLGFMDDNAKSNLGFEWLYMDFLVNGLNSKYLLQLIEQSKAFIYPHFIVLHYGVCSMNSLFSSMAIPLQLRYDFKNTANAGKHYGDSGGTDVDAFIKKYGSYIKSTLGG